MSELDGISSIIAFQQFIFSISSYSTVKVSLDSAQQVIWKTALTSVQQVLLRIKRLITQNENIVLNKKLRIWTTLLDIIGTLKPILDGFRNSSSSMSLNSTATISSKIIQIVLNLTNMLPNFGMFSFQQQFFKFISLNWLKLQLTMVFEDTYFKFKLKVIHLVFKFSPV